MKKITGYIIISIIVCVAALPFLFIVSGYHDAYQIIGKKLEYRPRLATTVYDVRGEVVAELFDENRRYVPLKKMPSHLRGAFIAAEDQNFYSHGGFDIFSIFRALAVDLVKGEIRQGGSTITQQLAKQLYAGNQRTLKRKMVELFISRELENSLSKDEILERYLNHIYFGHGVYGIGAASRFYFSKVPGKLGYGEAALLAALPSAPAKYSPIKHPRAAMIRSRQVLASMDGMGFIKKGDFREHYNTFWREYFSAMRLRSPSVSVHGDLSDRAPYFTDYIRKILLAKYGEERVYTGGLKVYTTLDLRMQNAAREALQKKILEQRRIADSRNRYLLKGLDADLVNRNFSKKQQKKLGKRFLRDFYQKMQGDSLEALTLMTGIFGDRGLAKIFDGLNASISDLRRNTRVQGALVAMDHHSGGIRAMIGGHEYVPGDQLNRAYQARRQPGSAFKIFVYGAGIVSEKITPATAFLDLPVIFKERKKTWAPSNYEKKFRGRVLARRALAASLNITSIKAYELLGGEKIALYASKLAGVPKKRFEVDPTLALGTSELTPLEMAAGISVYASGGIKTSPHGILRIEDSSGKVIHRTSLTGKRLISRESAFLMTSMLKGVVDYGTASGAVRSAAGFKGAAAGKTGTNTKYRDAWFAGYTPDLTAVVWLGCNSPKYSLGSGQGGAQAAAPVWGAFMKKISDFRKRKNFPSRPRGIVTVSICKKTGLLPEKGCSRRNEFFKRNTEPQEYCDGDHSDMMSVFDVAKKRKSKLLERELEKMKRRRLNSNEKEVEKSSDGYVIEEFRFQ